MLAARRTLGNPVGSQVTLVAWYDATQITGVADGTQISSWADLTGHGWTLTQSTSGNQPTYYSTTTAHLINGHSTVYFAGSSSSQSFSMHNTGFTLAAPLTVAIVAFAQTTTLPAKFLIADGNAAAYFTLSEDTGVNQRYQFQDAGGGIAGGTIDTNPHLICGVDNVASKSLTIDGTTVASGTVGGVGIQNGFYVGTDQPPAPFRPWYGAIGEIRIYSGAMNAAQIASLHTTLSAKWGTP